MRAWTLTAVISLAVVPLGASASTGSVTSATRARDVDGIALGMSIAEVRSRMTLEHVAFETFRGTVDGIDFDLGFTPAGRVFRIESTQHLGRFQPDQAFAKTLSAKLVAKYGPPKSMQLPDGTAQWSLIEPVANASGEKHPFTVMWASAMLSDDERGVTLVVTMLDFRILWADQARQNKAPSQEASEKIHL